MEQSWKSVKSMVIEFNYGNAADEMIPLVDINDGTATDYTITELPQGGCYFVMTTYDVEGLESGFSEIVYKEKF